MRVPGLQQPYLEQHPIQQQLSHQAQPSTKKVWRLKKYTKTDDEIQQEQKKYEDMEFTPRKASSRRPRNKPGSGNQEFVFVDLSPKKRDVQLDASTTSPSSNKDVAKTPKKQGNRVSRLFRLTSSQETLKESTSSPATAAATPKLMSSPEFRDSSIPSSQSIPTLKRSFTTLAAASRIEHRERSNSSTSLVMTISDSGRAVLQPSLMINTGSANTPGLVGNNSQHSCSLSPSSSTSDLYSLTRNNSSRQTTFYSRSPIPSPKRMESPIPQDRFPMNQPPLLSLDTTYKSQLDPELNNNSSEEDDDDSADAFKAFSKVLKKTNSSTIAGRRTRANTVSSITSSNSISQQSPSMNNSPLVQQLPIQPQQVQAKPSLTRNHSISSISSIYAKTARISPSRANLLRQATTPIPTTFDEQQRPSGFIFGDGSNSHSYFDEISSSSNNTKSNKPKRNYLHGKQHSISFLGPPLQLPSEPESESPYDDEYNDDENDSMIPFETSETVDDGVVCDTVAPSSSSLAAAGFLQNGTELMIDSFNEDGNGLQVGFNTDEFFDFNAFVNYESSRATGY